MRGMSVDFKLGLRMLRKSPGLTAVALFALSLAIGAGAAYLEFVNDLMHGKLPFPDADRIVGIQVWDQESGDPDPKQTANFVAWRDSLRSFEAARGLSHARSQPDHRGRPRGAGSRRRDQRRGLSASRRCRRCWAGRWCPRTSAAARLRSR